ncbi:MAG: Gfo/Idh/MocA family oxidoreductase [Planctomycetota bacterium]
MGSGDLRAAVVGVGHLGQHHARVYHEMPGVELVGVCDASEERAREVADRFSVPAFTDWKELPDDLQAVNVATPTVAHFEVAKYFLERSVPVLVEKPIAKTLEEARALCDLADERGVILQVGHIERFNPVIQAIRDFDIQPRFIESHRLAPYTFRSRDIGVVLDLMIHDLDIILELVQSPLVKVDAVGGAIFSRAEDMVNARLVFENGCVANVTANRVALKTLRRIRVFSVDSFITLDYEKHNGFICKKSESFDTELERIGAIDPKRLADPKSLVFSGLLEVKELEMDRYEPLAKELQSFITAIRNETPAEVSGRDGLRAMETALRIVEEIGFHSW